MYNKTFTAIIIHLYTYNKPHNLLPFFLISKLFYFHCKVMPKFLFIWKGCQKLYIGPIVSSYSSIYCITSVYYDLAILGEPINLEGKILYLRYNYHIPHHVKGKLRILGNFHPIANSSETIIEDIHLISWKLSNGDQKNTHSLFKKSLAPKLSALIVLVIFQAITTVIHGVHPIKKVAAWLQGWWNREEKDYSPHFLRFVNWEPLC